jgi:hypothetical protein
MNSRELQQPLQERQPFLSHDITRLVMTFTDPSASDEDTVGSGLKSLQHIVGRDRSSTHDPNRPDRCGILHSTDPSQVSCGISSPRAQESNNFRLKIISHHKLLEMNCSATNFNCQCPNHQKTSSAILSFRFSNIGAWSLFGYWYLEFGYYSIRLQPPSSDLPLTLPVPSQSEHKSAYC